MRSTVPFVNGTVSRQFFLVSPAFDTCFLLCAWLPLLVVFLPLVGIVQTGSDSAIAFLVFHLLLRLPHFMATGVASWVRPSQRLFWLAHPIELILIPIVLIAVFTATFFTPVAERSQFLRLLTLIAYIWGFQHIVMQSYGVLQLYHKRMDRNRPVWEQRLERMLFRGVTCQVVTPLVLGYGVWALVGITVPKTANTWISLAVTLTVFILACVYVLVAMKEKFIKTPAFIFAALSLLVVIEWPFYEHLPSGTWFMVFNSHHSLTYLGLVFLLQRHEAKLELPQERMAMVRTLLQAWLPLVLLSALVLGCLWVMQPRLLNNVMANTELLMGFFVAHYYIESRIWRFSHQHHRETTLSVLLNGSQSHKLLLTQSPNV